MNIPARYCTGYLGDIGVPPSTTPWIFPPGSRSISTASGIPSMRATTMPRIGRVLIAQGRDAADVALTSTFGPNLLKGFRVWTDELQTG